MNNQIIPASSPLPLPAPRLDITIRPATMDDLPFIDQLQKQHSKQLGFLHRKALEGKIEKGDVLIAESDEATERRSDEGASTRATIIPSDPSVSDPSSLRRSVASSLPLAYLIASDRYLKRDELGVIYQLCVVPGERRKLVAAALLKAQFDRSAYGCKLYCCWCAQDLAANHFWESMGFVPIAFRTGSRKGKKVASGPSAASSLRRSIASPRIHIFWQKRIRGGDTTTPWWFPAKTEGGAMREDRLVLPIPPNLHWSDEMPVLQSEQGAEDHPQDRSRRTLARPAPLAPSRPTQSPRRRPHVQFGLPGRDRPAPQFVSFAGAVSAAAHEPAPSPAPAPPREKQKCHPKVIQAARELRDRWLEAVERDPSLLLPAARYDLARTVPETPTLTAADRKLLAA